MPTHTERIALAAKHESMVCRLRCREDVLFQYLIPCCQALGLIRVSYWAREVERPEER